MKYLVGYQYREDDGFQKQLLLSKDSIEEIFFSWGSFPNGRSPMSELAKQNGPEMQAHMLANLQELSQAGISMNLLLNGNCYGADSLARTFYQKVGDTIDYLCEQVNLSSVTTTSPVIAKFIKENFENLEVRASVNMSIGTIEGMEYIEDLFDSFYLKREYNRDFERMKICRNWCNNHQKKLYLLANSGCLNYCSLETFHDNLVSHEAEIATKDNAFSFTGQCKTYLGSEEHRANWLSHTNFIRPEEVSLYENYCDGMKLATRVNPNPSRVLRAYIGQKYTGNLPGLLEPDHSGLFVPNIIDNSLLPKDFSAHVMHCNKDCENCNYCRDAQKNATIQFS